MANPTSNFGWQMPTPVDLVTDLPADFEVFGQAVDSSLADLKGGTSGQVLSKNSNTDMDFVWVTSDDANAIQNSIVDAKGDLIAATANDTPARLAVGLNTYVVMADSSTATGLTYGGAWTTWTPTFSNLTVGNGTVSARYRQIGKTIEVLFKFTLGSTSAIGTGPNFTLPFTSNLNIGGTGWWDKFGVGGNPFGYLVGSNICYPLSLNSAGTYLSWNTTTATNPTTWGTNDSFTLNFRYEAA